MVKCVLLMPAGSNRNGGLSSRIFCSMPSSVTVMKTQEESGASSTATPPKALCYTLRYMKTILITGGSDGLGKALAERLSKNHKVIILARNEAALKEIAAKTGCDY